MLSCLTAASLNASTALPSDKFITETIERALNPVQATSDSENGPSHPPEKPSAFLQSVPVEEHEFRLQLIESEECSNPLRFHTGAIWEAAAEDVALAVASRTAMRLMSTDALRLDNELALLSRFSEPYQSPPLLSESSLTTPLQKSPVINYLGDQCTIPGSATMPHTNLGIFVCFSFLIEHKEIYLECVITILW